MARYTVQIVYNGMELDVYEVEAASEEGALEEARAMWDAVSPEPRIIGVEEEGEEEDQS